jgi:hypothetical protein
MPNHRRRTHKHEHKQTLWDMCFPLKPPKPRNLLFLSEGFLSNHQRSNWKGFTCTLH